MHQQQPTGADLAAAFEAHADEALALVRRAAIAPLDDPAYMPIHQPVDGAVPDIVALWSPRSQLRWFRRFGDQLGRRKDWDRFYCCSEHHRGTCCYSCDDEFQAGTGMMMDGWCCCRDQRTATPPTFPSEGAR